MKYPLVSKEAVHRGAVLLDKERPAWAYRIDTVKLDMRSCSLCILGQLDGDYSVGLVRLRIPDAGVCGFALTSWPTSGAWYRLKRLWLAEIRSRLKQE